MRGGRINEQHEEMTVTTKTPEEDDATGLELEEEWLTRIGVGGWVQ